MNRKKCYKTPLIAQSMVELEEGFCVGSISDKESKVSINGQGGNENNGGTIDEDAFGGSDTWE